MKNLVEDVPNRKPRSKERQTALLSRETPEHPGASSMINRIVLMFLTLFVCTAAWAQFEAGSVVGVISDSSGLVIPGVSITLRNLSTNVDRQATTSSVGAFDFVAVSPGMYSITVKQTGFQERKQNFKLAVGQRLDMNMALQIGATAQTVTVSADVETLETASSEITNLRTSQQVVDLPLNARNFTQLLQLAPGVNNYGTSGNSISQGYTTGRGTNGAIINGNPSEDTVYMFDGIWSVENDSGDIFFFPPVDSIQEFQVQTSGAPASYGGNPSMINLTYHSGTNDFKGTFYEFVRNSDLDAKNYFDSPSKPIPPFHLNQFGANVGGPVRIPHLFNGTNKLFFFADYEGKRENQAQTNLSTVPIAAFHTGDFSALSTVLHVPGTTTPLPNNHVQTIDPTAANLMALFPLPNINPNSPALINNYLYNGANVNDINQGDIRIDYRTEKTSIFGRYSQENADSTTPGYLPAPAIGGGPSRPGQTLIPSKQVVLGYGRSIGANKYYEARLGFSRMTEQIVDADTSLGNLAQKLGIPGANVGTMGDTTGLTNFSISGNVGLGDGAGSLMKVNNDWEVAQAFSMVKGSHEFKVGFNWRSLRFAYYSPGSPVGTFSFTGIYTGYGLADFLYGRPTSSELDVSNFYSMLRFQPSVYLQDNWRLTPKLTLNYGFRDDLVTPWRERHNRLSGLVPDNGGNMVPVGTAPYYGNSLTRGRYTNFGPRFGFAYTINAKTVLRGGGGIFYAFENNMSNHSMAKNAPYDGSFIQTNSSGAAGYAAALPISAGFPTTRPLLFPVANSAFNYFSRRYPNPSANEWNLNIQRQLTSRDVLSVAYIGQTGGHILLTYNMNEATPGAGAVASRRPYPNLADGSYSCMCGNSVFHSLQVTYMNHLSRGLDFQGAWTWGHSIDDSSGVGNAVAPQNIHNFALFRGNSDFDSRQSAVLSWSYVLPFGRNKQFASNAHGMEQMVVGGWKLNSIDTFRAGSPFTPVMSTSLLNAGTGVQWPNRIGSGKVSNPTAKQWFNTADFVSPGQYTFGNSGRNILVGPGTKQVDASLFKDFPLSSAENRSLQFRAEIFNVLNTPQFNNPNASIGNAAAGTITAAGQPALFQRTSREIQLALKLYW